MTWVRLDDGFPRHRKVALLSDAAFRLHVCAICWCAEQLTDGRIWEAELPTVSPLSRKILAKAVPELVDRGVWDVTDGGWRIHDFLDYNPSRADVEKERKAKTERQARWRESKRSDRVDASTSASTAKRVDASTARLGRRPVDAAPSPPRPDPVGVGSGWGANSLSVPRKRPVDNSRPALSVIAECGDCRTPYRADPGDLGLCPGCLEAATA